MATLTSPLSAAKRIVIKIGSSLLVEPENGELKSDWLKALVSDIARLKSRGQEVVIVSSGAIALGRRVLNFKPATLKLEEDQAAASVGQVHLAHAFREALGREEIIAAQILVTLGDTEERRRYLNARNTIATLLRLGAVPVINENDTVATSEIRVGDNDRLAARVASMISADCLILLSNVAGLYTSAPEINQEAEIVAKITQITPEIEAMVSGNISAMGKGGMGTKLAAARIAMGSGIHMAVADGRTANPLRAIEQGEPCTWFVPTATPVAARKKWIAATLEPRGRMIIDAGAAKALNSGKSLLPAGIVSVEGKFDRSDTVSIVSPQGVELARGLSAYDDSNAQLIIGHKSSDIEAILGYRGRTEMIHRDDLVLMKGHVT
jgi:glutamate 5-kinase